MILIELFRWARLGAHSSSAVHDLPALLTIRLRHHLSGVSVD
jgi:hypothetical protein